MKRSPIMATLVVAFFLIGTPVALIRRLSDGVFPTQPYDIVLGVAVVAWVLVCKAILDRDTPMSALVENRLSPSWQANSLVEQSLLGVGLLTNKQVRHAMPSTQLHRLQPSTASIDSLLPPAPSESQSGRGRTDYDEDSRPRLQPALRQADPAAPPILATEEYVAARGDTFWSIAEERLGDGRRWKDIEALNVGRQVAPDVIFAEGAGVRIGWILLVPLAAPVVEEQQ